MDETQNDNTQAAGSDATAAGLQSGTESAQAEPASAPHPAHGVIDEIEQKLGEWVDDVDGEFGGLLAKLRGFFIHQ